MYKLKDIIASSGSNAKINKSIDRYVLSKKEKKDIIKNIKDISQNNNSSTQDIFKYYKFGPYNTNNEDRTIISNNCYEVLYTEDNYMNVWRKDAKCAHLSFYRDSTNMIYTKAICVLITDDLSWFNTLTDNTLVEITREEYDNILNEF